MTDCETLTEDHENIVSNNHIKDDFPGIGVDLIKRVNFKTAIFLFLMGLFIFSDVFIENFLPKETVDGYCADSRGTSIQLLVLVLMYILVDLLVQGNML